jgi:glycosyltransferase involved in cell wall biosynthesis
MPDNHQVVFIASLDPRTVWGHVFAECYSHFLKNYQCAIRPMTFKGLPFLFRQWCVRGFRQNKTEVIVGPAKIRPTPGKKTALVTRWDASIDAKLQVACANASALLILPSVWDWQQFCNHGYRRDQRAEIFPFGYNDSVFKPELNAPKSVVFGCTLDDQTDTVVGAFKHAFKNRNNVELVVRAFDGAVRDYKDPRITVRMEKAVESIDWIYNSLFFRSLTAYVSLKQNGAGISVVQSMACGTPVIGDYVGTKTGFFNSENGFPVSPREDMMFTDLYHEMRKIYFDPALAAGRREHCRKAVEPWSAIAKRVEQLLVERDFIQA